MLEVSHYTKRYGMTVACDDISFSLSNGSVAVLLGPNGAGKSTLMKGIVGLLRFEGRVLVDSLPNNDPKSRRALGYIPEIPAFYPNLTVAEHLEFVARAYRMRGHESRARELLERFSLTEHRLKLGSELSKGMAQKLNICLGLFTDPSVLLLDEPFIGLDPHAIKELKAAMEELRAQGKTLLVSTHIIDSVDMLWDRALVMKGGQLLASVAREQLDERKMTLEQLFFATTEPSEAAGDDSSFEGAEYGARSDVEPNAGVGLGDPTDMR